MPAAARIPAWRIPPPYMRRKRRSFSTVGRSDTITDPTGAPSPLDKQNETVSKWRAYSAADTPVATTALKSLAPSRCIGIPRARATVGIRSIVESGEVEAPPAVWVVSRQVQVGG